MWSHFEPTWLRAHHRACDYDRTWGPSVDAGFRVLGLKIRIWMFPQTLAILKDQFIVQMLLYYSFLKAVKKWYDVFLPHLFGMVLFLETARMPKRATPFLRPCLLRHTLQYLKNSKVPVRT